jgi:hypothetical protein
MAADTAWRLLTGAVVPDGALETIGPAELVDPLLVVRSNLV